MTSTASIVHFRARNSSVVVSHFHPFQNLSNVPDRYFSEIFNVRAFGWRFTNLEVVWCVSTRYQEVTNMLIVNLKVGDTDRVVYAGRIIGFYSFKKVATSTWDEAGVFGSAHLHRISLVSQNLLTFGGDRFC